MRNPRFALLAAAIAASLSSTAFAQNDDCTGALPLVGGLNGPFDNLTATTSFAWPCAAGGNDVWFSYVAPASANVTFRTCGQAAFDTAIEVFDGTAGCGSLTSIICNDDSCGLQSSVTIAATQGTTYFVRVGGFNGARGTFSLEVGVTASVASYGTGCVSVPGNPFYEFFATASAMDLSGSSMSMIYTGTGYLMLPGIVPYVAPSPTATALALTDDSQITVPLSAPLRHGRFGSTNELTVCSNGYVSTAVGNGTAFSPTVASFLNHPQTAWYTWHDFNPARSGSGPVRFEEIGGVAYVTFDGVSDFSSASTTPNTFQFQFDLATGNVHIHWVQLSGLGNAYLVGFHEGGAATDPGARDLSAEIPTTFLNQFNTFPLAISTSANPVAGNTINLNTSNITPTAPFGAVLMSLTQDNFDLSVLGMPGCSRYNLGDVSLLFFPQGAGTVSTALTVPNLPGLRFFAQSAVYDPAAGFTPLGAVTSNGLDLGVGNF
jgi:hypothetical protein